MRVLVTGAAGFIGSSVSEALLARGDQVIGVDNFNTFYDPQLKEQNIIEATRGAADRFGLLRLDIRDPVLGELVSRPETRPDVICHLAAWAGVRPSIKDPLTYQTNNVEGTNRLLELARAHGIKPFVFASSSSVYGARTHVPFKEDDRVDDPISPYAATKKAGELIGYTYHHLFGIHFTALRFFTVYGPRQRPEMAIHAFARSILEGKKITLYGDGRSSRDYTYIDDCVAGVLAAIDRTRDRADYRIYNLGCSTTTSLTELVRGLEVVLGKSAIVEHAPDQPGDVPLTYADISLARSELGYAPTTPVPAGLERFAQWLLARRARG